MAFYTTTVYGKLISKRCTKIAKGLVFRLILIFHISKNTCLDIQTRVFGNQLAKECNTWTNARSIVHAWVKTIFLCSLSTSLSCTFGLQKFEQRNFFLATYGVRNLEDLSVTASSVFYNCDMGSQCKVRLPLIKKPQL